MIWLRKTALVLHLLRGLLTCALLFPWLGVRSREWHIRRWSRRLLRICGVEVEVVDATGAAHTGAARQGAMVVSNHISWLDIYVIHSWQPVRFVAKSEIRSWPLIGWLCDKTGTIFIERARKRDAHRVLHDITDVMLQGDLVGVFPEGTTTDGTSVLPFHANLMQAPISGGLPVQPLGLSYLDKATGQLSLAPAYIGELSLLQSLDAVLKAAPITARLVLAPPLDSATANRRELAEEARQTVVKYVQGARQHADTMPSNITPVEAVGRRQTTT
ncbi:Phospholipid/glycerol acyltransferase; 1-ACYL-SN-GLYCEROL-3-PHOSPHATE ACYLTRANSFERASE TRANSMEMBRANE PROTEIN [Cupriavidus taiwanensis]|uniref:lysophospholipid acyltransferase family protein n=1 Tax=Cupriavidus taiwanensis TaxID=164546 RepID=UPI000E162121|nr:lysophospholipid acyltransferase family protein [Cupriavidus taiwanensis]SOZ13922.1 Phospholipid/glycerol acyltransferase; 1-ACYL-SN-GLYCEROL-3-PHOSPHATE ACYLTRANSFERASE TRANSMEMBRANE PROTEIN [Cupriavidus taiwanensis]SOZ25285.1 Phospholipid/glycerol acyltransferase; 1-ACYL-SN-GLYCEROL-3-PHOSPHATE ACYLTRANSFERASE TRANSMEMBRANE PROTEIN [Cupriavidus taiwanensis]SOZ44536.1 Phospholipid/glycerol acyltransferase; 1-ACYL-SN-GLYCEROL-3-PHOSPHATE ACYLTRANSFERASE TRANSMEMBRANE PROTEIN [Cupriavidus taiw